MAQGQWHIKVRNHIKHITRHHRCLAADTEGLSQGDCARGQLSSLMFKQRKATLRCPLAVQQHLECEGNLILTLFGVGQNVYRRDKAK